MYSYCMARIQCLNTSYHYFFNLVEILKIFFLTLLGATAWNASAPAAVAPPPPEAIILEKVIRHNRKAKGRFGRTGTVPSVSR